MPLEVTCQSLAKLDLNLALLLDSLWWLYFGYSQLDALNFYHEQEGRNAFSQDCTTLLVITGLQTVSFFATSLTKLLCILLRPSQAAGSNKEFAAV